MKRILFALAILVGVVPAWAQNYTRAPTPDPGQYVPVFVQACLNASGQAIPVSGSCATAMPVSGAVTANQGTPGAVPWPIAEQGSALSSVGVAPSITTSGTTLVGKASPGNLYGAYAYNTSTTAGFLVAVNLAAAPAAAATISPVECVPLPASGSATVNYGAGPPDSYSTGIVILASTSCTTYTPSTISAFLKARTR